MAGTPLAPGFPFPASAFLTCPHSSVIPQYRNLHLLSIGYDSRPRLRPRLTQGRSALPWKPWIFGLRILTLSRYSFRHSLFHAVHSSLRYCFVPHAMLLYQPFGSLVSVVRFSPGHFRRRTSRPVSYYALFE